MKNRLHLLVKQIIMTLNPTDSSLSTAYATEVVLKH